MLPEVLPPPRGDSAHGLATNTQTRADQRFPTLFWTTDADLRLTLALRGSLTSTTGLRPAGAATLGELLGCDDPDFPPLACLPRVLAGETAKLVEEIDGHAFEFHIRPLSNEHGVASGVIGVAFDLTERQQTEQEIRDRFDQLTALHQVGQALNRLTEPNELLSVIHLCVGRVLDVRNFYVALYDEASQFVSFPVYTIEGHPELRPSRPFANGITEYVIRTRAPLLIREHLSQRLRELGIDLMGRTAESLVAVPMQVGDKVIGVMCLQDYENQNTFTAAHVELLTTFAAQAAVALDNARLYLAVQDELASRKQAEQTLAEHEHLLRDGQAIAHMGSFHLDVVANKVAWSDEQFRIFGHEPRLFEPSYERFMAQVHPEHRAQVQRAIERCVTAHEPYDNQYRIVRPSGEVRWVHSRGRAIANTAGTIVAFAGVCQDVTERKRLEEQFHQAQRLAAIGQMAGGVAHNFNNIMTVITGYGSMLQNELGSNHPLNSCVEEIVRAAERAATLTRRILAFSRKQMLQPKVLCLNSVAANVRTMLAGMIHEHVEVVLELDPQLWAANVDEGRVEEALLNLAINARDAMPTGGRLTIASANYPLEKPRPTFQATMPAGRYVCLSLTDTGCGMDDHVKAHLFEPFFTTKGVGQGTGLGLPSVYGIVQQSDGFIEVDSEVGRGTTIALYFPTAPEAALESPAVSIAKNLARGSETVLVVEDDDSVRSMIRHVLSERGYHILEASQGAEALDLAGKRRGTIDLVLTDVMMPQMSGPRLVRRLRQDRPNVKVLYMSGHTDSVLTRQQVAASAQHFLSKPFTPLELAETVRKVLDGN